MKKENKKIGCTVETCKYNCCDDACCSLNDIEVGCCNCEPHCSDNTCCRSFEAK